MSNIIRFICPECGGSQLTQIQQGFISYPVTKISEEGNFDFDYKNQIIGDSETKAYQCNDCGYELLDGNGNPIIENVDVYDWIRENYTDLETQRYDYYIIKMEGCVEPILIGPLSEEIAQERLSDYQGDSSEYENSHFIIKVTKGSDIEV